MCCSRTFAGLPNSLKRLCQSVSLGCVGSGLYSAGWPALTRPALSQAAAWSHFSFPTVTPICMSPQNTMLQSQVPNPSAASPPPHTSGGSGAPNLTAGGEEGPGKEVGHVISNPCNIWQFQNQTTTGVHSPEKLSVWGAAA